MPNIIADEMRRQARREMKGDIMALKSGYTALRRKVAENSKRLACLEKDVKKLQSEQKKDQSRDEKSAQRKYRIGSMTLKRIRGKGGFTQNDLATVLGVSPYFNQSLGTGQNATELQDDGENRDFAWCKPA